MRTIQSAAAHRWQSLSQPRHILVTIPTVAGEHLRDEQGVSLGCVSEWVVAGWWW